MPLKFNRRNLSYFTLSILFITFNITHAKKCIFLTGDWLGEWRTHQGETLNATIRFDALKNQQFHAKYFLSNGEHSIVQVTCKILDNHEATLKFRGEAPWYNPCRGHLLLNQNSKQFRLHVFCYNPNEGGFFKKQ